MASIRQRPNGSWRARFRDADGKEHGRHFPLKRDAQRWLDEVTASVVTGIYVDPRAGTALWDDWVSAWVARQAWASGTVQAAETALYSVQWRRRPIGNVKPSDIQAWVSGEMKRGLAASTMRTRLNYVQMAFRAAVMDKVIAESPASAVKPPRARRSDAAMEILTLEQTAAVLAHAGEFRPFVEVCMFAGLRLGEAAGLQLGDVNFPGPSRCVGRCRAHPSRRRPSWSPNTGVSERSTSPESSPHHSRPMSPGTRSQSRMSTYSARPLVIFSSATTRGRSGAASANAPASLTR